MSVSPGLEEVRRQQQQFPWVRPSESLINGQEGSWEHKNYKYNADIFCIYCRLYRDAIQRNEVRELLPKHQFFKYANGFKASLAVSALKRHAEDCETHTLAVAFVNRTGAVMAVPEPEAAAAIPPALQPLFALAIVADARAAAPAAAQPAAGQFPSFMEQNPNDLVIGKRGNAGKSTANLRCTVCAAYKAAPGVRLQGKMTYTEFQRVISCPSALALHATSQQHLRAVAYFDGDV